MNLPDIWYFRGQSCSHFSVSHMHTCRHTKWKIYFIWKRKRKPGQHMPFYKFELKINKLYLIETSCRENEYLEWRKKFWLEMERNRWGGLDFLLYYSGSVLWLVVGWFNAETNHNSTNKSKQILLDWSGLLLKNNSREPE